MMDSTAHGDGAELIAHPLDSGAADVGHPQSDALGGEQSAQVVADAADALDGHPQILQIRAAQSEPSRGLHAQEHSEGGLRRRDRRRLRPCAVPSPLTKRVRRATCSMSEIVVPTSSAVT